MNYFKEKVKKLIWREGYGTSQARLEDRFLMGECLLEMKKNMWDTTPFVPKNWDEFGFKVFSQSNEDGLIQYLINHVEIPNKTFIEFGVENYTECNTRFLLLHNNWSGYVMDGSTENMDALMKSEIYWQHDIVAKSVFITKENINDLISERGFDEEVGLLSIDIDGNDYWVWDAINCIRPCIVIVEYNPIYGLDVNVSIPYKADFYRTTAHYCNLYFGASLSAFVQLGKKKGYSLVCTNQFGNNAFFVRDDLIDSLPVVPAASAWRKAKCRESRDENGNLTFLPLQDGIKLMENMMVVDVIDGSLKKIKDCCNKVEI